MQRIRCSPQACCCSFYDALVDSVNHFLLVSSISSDSYYLFSPASTSSLRSYDRHPMVTSNLASLHTSGCLALCPLPSASNDIWTCSFLICTPKTLSVVLDMERLHNLVFSWISVELFWVPFHLIWHWLQTFCKLTLLCPLYL